MVFSISGNTIFYISEVILPQNWKYFAQNKNRGFYPTSKLPSFSDSYVAVQLIDKQNTLNFKSLKYMAEKIEGSFCFTVLSKDNELYFVKGDNPMCITHFNGFYIYASTKEILTKALKKLGLKKYKEVSIKEGEILKIDTEGNRSRDEFKMNYCYDYGWYDYGGRPYYYGYGRKKNKEFTDEYLEELVACAKSKGIDKSTVYECFLTG